MTGRMRWIGFLLAATTAACVADDADDVDVDVDVAGIEQAISHERTEVERVLCTRDACLLTYDHDSDGDGVSDLDERALGTDPLDPASRPYNLEVIDLATRDVLPSLELGHSMIVLLPTQDPRGMPVLGGRDALPGRYQLLDRMGISRDQLDGLDPSRGLSLFRRPGGGPRFGVRGVGMSLVGRAHDEVGLLPHRVRVALDGSPNRDWGPERVDRGDGTATIHRFNGSTDTVSWSAGTSWMVSRDARGNQTWSIRTQGATATDSAGNNTTTTTNESSNGRTTTTGTETRTTSPGGETGVEREWNRTTKNADGSTTTEKGSETTSPDDETHNTVVTETCDAESNCSSTVTESDPPEQTCGVTIDCDSGGGNAYADPDSGFASSVVTTESVMQALIVLGATIHTIEPDGSAVDYAPDPSRVDRWGPVSLVTEDASVGGVLIFRGYNTAGPEFDPDLPQPEVGVPGSEPCTTCR